MVKSVDGGAGPDAPHTTLKFARVQAVEVPEATPGASGAPSHADGTPSPGSAPGWNDDEVPTLPGSQIAAARLETSRAHATLTILAGLNAGQVFTLDGDEATIGRGRDVQIRFDEAGVSRRHARIARTQAGAYELSDLGSTNGVFVNGRSLQRAALANGDRIQVGEALVLRFGLVSPEEESLARRLYEDSTRDAMTRVYNRKYASERLAAEIAFAGRHGSALGLVIFDLDHFKRVNDSHGHLAGDVVLRVVAAQVQRAIRAEDVLARYGGEEFVIVARGIEHQSVLVLAERVRRHVEQLSIPWDGRTLKVTVSVGAASLSEIGARPTSESLVALADERLYQAKATGRNRVR